MKYVSAIRAIVGIGSGVTVAKRQNIRITGRGANRRIERAIPIFMKKFGMAMDQATAVAIRLESKGRLQVDGEPINKPKGVPRGEPADISPAFVAGIATAMSTDRTPKRTEYRDAGDGFVVSSAFDALVRINKKKRPPRNVRK